MAIFLKKIHLITVVAILLLSCSVNNAELNQRSNCQNGGTIDFIYVNIPCESCIQFIEQLIEQNNNIFDYNIIAKNNQHILINYCYNHTLISKLEIESFFRENGFIANQEMNENQLVVLESLCCIN